MHIENRPLKFKTITHHASVTQCLGSIGGGVWYLGVAKPSILDATDQTEGDPSQGILKSTCGHFYMPPHVEDCRVFKVTGSKFLKLNRGTWHAGPIFKGNAMDFYNLELSNTNVRAFSYAIFAWVFSKSYSWVEFCFSFGHVVFQNNFSNCFI